MKLHLKLLSVAFFLLLSITSLTAQVDSTRRVDRLPSPFTLASALLDPITLPASLDRDVEKMLEQWYSPQHASQLGLRPLYARQRIYTYAQ